jgi:hypothetical protein
VNAEEALRIGLVDRIGTESIEDGFLLAEKLNGHKS